MRRGEQKVTKIFCCNEQDVRGLIEKQEHTHTNNISISSSSAPSHLLLIDLCSKCSCMQFHYIYVCACVCVTTHTTLCVSGVHIRIMHVCMYECVHPWGRSTVSLAGLSD